MGTHLQLYAPLPFLLIGLFMMYVTLIPHGKRASLACSKHGCRLPLWLRGTMPIHEVERGFDTRPPRLFFSLFKLPSTAYMLHRPSCQAEEGLYLLNYTQEYMWTSCISKVRIFLVGAVNTVHNVRLRLRVMSNSADSFKSFRCFKLVPLVS